MSGVYIPLKMRSIVAKDAGGRCGYCRIAEALTGGPLHFDHIDPLATGGLTELENLWLSCGPCNLRKSSRTVHLDPVSGETVPLFHPRRQIWNEHFEWILAGEEIAGLTPTGRATVLALQLNLPVRIDARRLWISAGWHPPKD